MKKFYRLNHQINAPEIRLLDSEGKQVGVMSTSEALKKAQEEELDLVEIAPEAKPPVVKIIDYKKFLYLEEKKQKEARKNTKETELKEIRVTPFIGEHDLQVALQKAKNFLGDGDLVKVSVVFRGRQLTHTEFGPKLLEKILGQLSGIGEKDREPRWEGKRYVCIIKPTKVAVQKAQQEKTKVNDKPASPTKGDEQQTIDNKQNEENETEKQTVN